MNQKTKDMVSAALCVALGLIVPQVFHLIPFVGTVPNLGGVFLPMHIPVLLCGLLCGYPVGARLCADFRQRGQISPLEADCLLAICNHPSPMFLLGYVKGQLAAPGILLPMLTAVYFPVPILYYMAVRL